MGLELILLSAMVISMICAIALSLINLAIDINNIRWEWAEGDQASIESLANYE